MKTTIKFRKIKIDKTGCHLLIKVSLNKKPVWMVLDTGASQTVIDYHVAKAISKNEALKMEDSASRGVGGEQLQSHLIAVEEFKMGKLVIKNYEFVLIDLKHVNSIYHTIGVRPVQGVLGSDIMNAYDAVINFKKRQLELNSGASRKKKVKRIIL